MKTKALKFASTSTLALLVLAGCSKKDKEEDIVVAKPVVVERVFDCNDFSLQNRLNDSLKGALLDASLARLVGLPSEQAYQIEAKIREQVLNTSIQADKTANQDSGCIADVYFSPAAEDMLAADYAMQGSGTTMLSRAAAAGVQIVDGRVLVPALDYRIMDNKAVLNNPQHSALAFLADIMVAAATTDRAAIAAANGELAPGASRPQVMDRQMQMDTANGAMVPPVGATTTTPSNNTNTTVTRRVEQTRPTAQRPAEQPKRAQPPRRAENTETEKTVITRTPKRAETPKQPAEEKPAATKQAPKNNDAEPAKQSLPKPATVNPSPNASISVVETEDTY